MLPGIESRLAQGMQMAKLANVLIVDDNPRCLEFMTLAFEAQGGVTVASELRPVNAVERIRVEKPDLVVLDVKMPDVFGFGFCRRTSTAPTPADAMAISKSRRRSKITVRWPAR